MPARADALQLGGPEPSKGRAQRHDAARGQRLGSAFARRVCLCEREEHRLPARGATAEDLARLPLDARVDRHEHEREIGAVRDHGAHGLEDLMPWRVDKGKRVQRGRSRNAILGGWEPQERRAHTLRDAASLPCRSIRSQQRIEQRCLAVVHVRQHRHDARATGPRRRRARRRHRLGISNAHGKAILSGQRERCSERHKASRQSA